MQKVYLSFLWHMHQPYYKDDIEQKTYMPWVFLHAIKDYYDIPYLSAKWGIKATYNLVPSLLKQLDDYASKTDEDILLHLIQKDTHTKKEMEFLQRFLFASHEQNMIKPLPRYFALFTKFDKEQIPLHRFSKQELLDTKVLFLLSWCGNVLKKEEFIKALIAQEKGFSSLQKKQLLEYLREFVGRIIPFYKELMQKQKIDLCTTPFFHPITPLLIDKKEAQKANKDTALPPTKTDLSLLASMQLQKGVALFKHYFDVAPTTMWPAEGGISQRALQLFKSLGIETIGSDEEILYNSKAGAKLYEKYSYDDVLICFRDKRLSDMIGFEFSTLDPKEAVERFMGYLAAIEQDESFVNVILDGENAWEYYKDNAKDFFSLLYQRLAKDPSVEVVFLDQHRQKAQPLDHLASGSWIAGNFDIWMGHEEKNTAWEFIDRVYELFRAKEGLFTKEQKDKIYNEFLIATGSDWFWWYGEDHYTFFQDEFDTLFRKHLINIYTLIDEQIPAELLKPIHGVAPKEIITHPQTLLSIKEDNYFQWLGCGEIEFNALSTMHTDLYAQKALFGYDQDSLYFKIIYQKSFKGRVDIYLEDKKYSFESEQLIKLPLPKKKSVSLKFVFEKGLKREVFPAEGTIELPIKDFSMNWFV